MSHFKEILLNKWYFHYQYLSLAGDHFEMTYLIPSNVIDKIVEE